MLLGPRLGRYRDVAVSLVFRIGRGVFREAKARRRGRGACFGFEARPSCCLIGVGCLVRNVKLGHDVRFGARAGAVAIVGNALGLDGQPINVRNINLGREVRFGARSGAVGIIGDVLGLDAQPISVSNINLGREVSFGARDGAVFLLSNALELDAGLTP